MLIGFSGLIVYANATASKILGIPENEMEGQSFASLFFDKPQNDEFSQAVIDSIYDRERQHDTILTYMRGEEALTLRMMTSFYIDGEERKGIIAVFSDVSEMMELRDEYGTSIIIVTHNIGVAAYMGDKIVVMKDGMIVEQGDRDQILNRSENPYTTMLMDAVPSLGGARYV